MLREMLKLSAAAIVANKLNLADSLGQVEERESKSSLLDTIKTILVLGAVGAGGYGLSKLLPNKFNALRGKIDALPRTP